jgi:hypothetical protein
MTDVKITWVFSQRPTLDSTSRLVQIIAALNLRHNLCEACGGIKPKGQSCGCFDNGGQ